MPKRKRSDYEHSSRGVARSGPELDGEIDGEADGIEATRSIAIQQKTIEQKIHHHRILLKRALKTAKGFEQQKLGKRLKSARKGRLPSAKVKDGKEEVERLEKELEVLKHVDLQLLATTYLNKTLLKNRQLSNSKYFPPSVAKEVEEHSKLPVPVGPVANVCARMLNANPVKEALKEIIGNVGQLFGLENDEDVASKAAKETENDATERVEPKATIHGKGRNLAKAIDSDPEEQPGSEDDEMLDGDDDAVVHPSMLKDLATRYLKNRGKSSSSEDEYEEEAELDNRIAWSSEGEDEDEADDITSDEDDRPRGRSMSITPIPEEQLQQLEDMENEDLDIDLSEDEDDDDDDDTSEPKAKPKPKKSAPKPPLPPAPTGPIKASSFLPTLMTGYISGSDSDASSTSSTGGNKKQSKKNKAPPEKKIRKNRMGQQARRALAERKFGESANHVKKEKEEKEAKVREKVERKKAWEEQQNKPVHMSWQLKKKDKDEKDKIMKDMMAGNAGSGMGKKIVFD
ncbi:hypothetical protein ABW20_dc0105134 [Dactylellina cionopaga]|nr:hypothetical protein ABW20_dc0105134 [Dactylellina cionopaga]